MKSYAIICLLVLSGCHPYSGRLFDKTQYHVRPDTITPHGVHVDTKGLAYPLEEIDKRVDALEKCLGVRINREGFTVTLDDEFRTSPCTGKRHIAHCAVPPSSCSMKIRDGSLKTLPASPCVFDQQTGKALKIVQGRQTECTECPCSCRAKAQDVLFGPPTVVTEPGLELFPGELARIILSVGDVWRLGPEVTKCLSHPPVPDALIKNWLDLRR